MIDRNRNRISVESGVVKLKENVVVESNSGVIMLKVWGKHTMKNFSSGKTYQITMMNFISTTIRTTEQEFDPLSIRSSCSLEFLCWLFKEVDVHVPYFITI